jgi:hypothetical protein
VNAAINVRMLATEEGLLPGMSYGKLQDDDTNPGRCPGISPEGLKDSTRKLPRGPLTSYQDLTL